MTIRLSQPLLVLLASLASLSTSAPARAVQVDHIETRYEGGEYRLSLTATLAAPLAQVEAVLRDYVHYPELDGRIMAVHTMTTAVPGELRLYTRIHVCVSFVCRDVDRVERVQEQPGELLATVIPEQSDAERGETRTSLLAQGEHTRVQYTTMIVPKFWVPAWFGRSLMLRTLRDGTVSLFQQVEQRAGQPDGSEVHVAREP